MEVFGISWGSGVGEGNRVEKKERELGLKNRRDRCGVRWFRIYVLDYVCI